MSLFPPRKRETIPFGDTTFDLYELSGLERCEYLAKTTGHLEVTEEGELRKPVITKIGQLWDARRRELSNNLLLVAYALRPGREESLEELHQELCKSVVPEHIDTLYIPAAKLSGFYFEVDALYQENSPAQTKVSEAPEKKE
ncbi:hypothetical protein [Microbulbifer spongiae]|uniref:Uncharacterized protein n=1 Tax=Microbulbifer spongiae TaxID=2944933 RepID=A0ABY9EF98_9GAMM|nr:hypothetical protein [Microbulbifer sp. MI-G]WKD51688.1 hypothetical protein M8T91_18710 [Microbulbifer sp. MI-G]